MKKPAAPALSRRGLLLSALAAGTVGVVACDAGSPPPSRVPSPGNTGAPPAPPAAAPIPSAPAPPAPPPATSGGLELVRLGPMAEDEKGGQLVVLLHGWRAPGDDLVSLARELARPRTRFLVPAAPLPEPGGGRAWWQIGRGQGPEKVWKDELPATYHANAQVTAARLALQALLREARERYTPDSIALVGFSQGAQLALDVALAAEPRVQRVAALSGALIADSLPALRAAAAPLPAVFVSHGRDDRVLPFAGATSFQALLAQRGYAVTFFPFSGGHAIPPDVVAALGRFLAGGAG